VSQELKIEVDFRLDGDNGKPSPDEIALVYTMLPELIKLMHDMDEQNEAA
jgi:hypothetical protein